jgi:3-oxoacyl-(acyl-carrier-protein) synthase
VAITGMAVNTPLGDTLSGFLDALLSGRSAISHWKGIDVSRVYPKVGGDLTEYDIRCKLASLEGRIPDDVYHRTRKLVARDPWSEKLSVLLAVDGCVDAALFGSPYDPTRASVVVAGHNINQRYQHDNLLQFEEEPDYIDPMLGLHGQDTDHAARISEALGTHGPIYTIGAACASGNAALRAATDEIKYHDVDVVVVTGAVWDLSAAELQAMALMGAISIESFSEEPARASRPFDVRREGFVPTQGGAALVLEDLETAMGRGARIYAELLGVEATSDATHLPQPSEEGQTLAMKKALQRSGLAPEEIDYVNEHATSTPLGDLVEARSLKRVFGSHLKDLKVNATKSMVGHTCCAAAAVETVAAVLQLNAGVLHPSINIEEIEPEVDFDVCAHGAVQHGVRTLMKTSFGFGGINCVSVIRRVDA